MSSEGWTTIESEPGVFHQLIAEFGVQGLQVEELWSLDKESLEALRPVYGLVFLFKWTPEKDTRPVAQDTLNKVFFAKQVIQNACATQAILSVLLNAQGLDLGPQLQQFKDFTADFPPDMKGLAIGNSDAIRLAHNGFARPEPLVPEEKSSSPEDEAFHFISYVPVEGTLYELDGLKEGPIPLCSCTDGDWLAQVVPHIQERMARYTEKEVRFNIMALVKDRLVMSEQRVQQCNSQRQEALLQLQALDAAPPHSQGPVASGPEAGPEAGSSPMEVDHSSASQLGSSREGLRARVHALEAELAALQLEIQEEQDKRHRWHHENVRRRHNYVPFLFNMLRHLADQQQLEPLVQRARELARQKQGQ